MDNLGLFQIVHLTGRRAYDELLRASHCPTRRRETCGRRLLSPRSSPRDTVIGSSRERKSAALRQPDPRAFQWTIWNQSNKGRNMLAIRLPADVEARLEALAKATGRTKTFYVREAILEHLDDLEDLYLAEQRLIDIRAGRTQTVPLEEVMKRYGMEG